jgi:cysteine-rich CPCC protein
MGSCPMFENIEKPWTAEKAYRCPCCRYKTLHSRGDDEICPVCFWEDDGQDDHDADEVRGGPNGLLSLAEARIAFKQYGVYDTRFRENVRLPLPDEE